MRNRLLLSAGLAVLAAACGPTEPDRQPAPEPAPPTAELTVADTTTRAQAPDGTYISWAEHLVDAEDVNGGEPIRGGDGLVMADLDRDGFLDIVSAQEDSNHLRVAFGSADPDVWALKTIAMGELAAAIEDVAVGDLNGDGWPDIMAACEEAHLAYFENPGEAAREAEWAYLIPPMTEGRGSWLRVFIADMNGDGRPDVTAANKGTPDIVRPDAGDRPEGPVSLFTLSGPPLEAESWTETVLHQDGVPNTALPVDFDGDGDMDVLAAARVRHRMSLLEQTGLGEHGLPVFQAHPIRLQPTFPVPGDWAGLADAFQADFADLDGDGRLDLAVNVIELRGGSGESLGAGLGWLSQPESLDEPWAYHRIGNILPDWVTGIELADIDGDGDMDAVVGGYSGLNILAGAYSGASREHDEPGVTPSSSVARIAWFENPGDPSADWTRHDISRRVRGMYDMFVPRDMDGDGDMDLVATRGNAGSFDGVFWLEQVRSVEPRKAFTPARASESRPLPLPPADWMDHYDREATYTAPNKVE